jgi:hypothetical protein
METMQTKRPVVLLDTRARRMGGEHNEFWRESEEQRARKRAKGVSIARMPLKRRRGGGEEEERRGGGGTSPCWHLLCRSSLGMLASGTETEMGGMSQGEQRERDQGIAAGARDAYPLISLRGRPTPTPNYGSADARSSRWPP